MSGLFGVVSMVFVWCEWLGLVLFAWCHCKSVRGVTCFSLCHTWFGMDDCMVCAAK